MFRIYPNPPAPSESSQPTPRAARFAFHHATPNGAPAAEVDPMVQDHAKSVLAASNELNDDERAILWEDFHSAPSANVLARMLRPRTDISDELKHELFVAKKKGDPEPSAVERAVNAIHRLKSIGTKSLELAEKHKTVTNILTDANNPK